MLDLLNEALRRLQEERAAFSPNHGRGREISVAITHIETGVKWLKDMEQ